MRQSAPPWRSPTARRRVSPSAARKYSPASRHRRNASSPKYLYDERGSQLFDEICSLPRVLRDANGAGLAARRTPRSIAALVGPRADVVELGAGSSLKARLLLASRRSRRAICPSTSRQRTCRSKPPRSPPRIPDVAVHPVLADFTRPFALRGARARANARVFSGLHDRQPVARARGGAARVARRAHRRRRFCSASTSARTRPCCTPPTTTAAASPRPST